MPNTEWRGGEGSDEQYSNRSECGSLKCCVFGLAAKANLPTEQDTWVLNGVAAKIRSRYADQWEYPEEFCKPRRISRYQLFCTALIGYNDEDAKSVEDVLAFI